MSTDLERLKMVANDLGTELRSYSGRGMYGAECAAMSIDYPLFAIEAAGMRGIGGAHYDQLGKGYIVYWPNIPAPKED